MDSRTPARLFLLVLTLAAVSFPSGGAAQQRVDLPGSVVDVATGRGVADVALRVEGTDVSAASDAQGRFVIRGLPAGRWTLRVDHVAYGTHRQAFEVDPGALVELQIRLAPEAMELEPIVVEVETALAHSERAQGSSLNVVERDQIERALGTSKTLGDLIGQTVPGIRVRQANNLAGTDICLEFRGAASISLTKHTACSHPMVLLDGVPVSDPNYLYGAVGLSNIERIKVIPPGDAGARYGTGSLYGVILIDTRTPGGPRRTDALSHGPVTFDWSTEPAGHPLGRAMLGALVGNSVGLAAGVALGERCIGVDDRHQIVTSCSRTGNTLAVLGAMALPALGGALGVRLGGTTSGSVGRLIPALLGAGMVLFPGYAFSMSTVGGGSAAANEVGHALLAVGVPLVLTVSDRLFRSAR